MKPLSGDVARAWAGIRMMMNQAGFDIASADSYSQNVACWIGVLWCMTDITDTLSSKISITPQAFYCLGVECVQSHLAYECLFCSFSGSACVYNL